MKAEHVRNPHDLLDCEPYRCRMMALACAKRQALAKNEKKLDFARCVGCADGELVTLRIGPVKLGRYAGAEERSRARGAIRAHAAQEQERVFARLAAEDEI